MNISDLRKFLLIAQVNHLQQASLQLNQTTGALSKTIKRLEAQLNTPLFDRAGRNIVLNQQGEKFRFYAQHIVDEADKALSDFVGDSHKVQVNIAGPALLMQHSLMAVMQQLAANRFELNLQVDWEGQALSLLSSGQADVALVTELSVSENRDDLAAVPLGQMQFQLAASAEHVLFDTFRSSELSVKALAEFAFACPSVSPFCGIKRGVGSDGWRDDKAPRKIGFRCNDFAVLMMLVQQGRALAYVPDFIVEQYGLRPIDVYDYDFSYQESIVLAYQPRLAVSWLIELVESMRELS